MDNDRRELDWGPLFSFGAWTEIVEFECRNRGVALPSSVDRIFHGVRNTPEQESFKRQVEDILIPGFNSMAPNERGGVIAEFVQVWNRNQDNNRNRNRN